MATPDLVSHCEAAFAGHPVIEKPAAADLAKALGEYRLVLEEGYPTSAGFWGANAKSTRRSMARIRQRLKSWNLSFAAWRV